MNFTFKILQLAALLAAVVITDLILLAAPIFTGLATVYFMTEGNLPKTILAFAIALYATGLLASAMLEQFDIFEL